MAIIKYAKTSHQTLSRIITYVCKDEKTTEKLISGKDCLAESALLEMQTIKDMHGKSHGRQYIHLVQAFPKDEIITPDTAHEIAIKLASKFNGFQCLIATHIDREHIHSHIIINSVNMETGLKFQQSKDDMQAVKDFSDGILREYGLSVLEPNPNSKGYRHYIEHMKELNGEPTHCSTLREDIDRLLPYSFDFIDLLMKLKKIGYTVRQGKYISIKAPTADKGIQIKSLGENYLPAQLTKRIQEVKRNFDYDKPKPKTFNLPDLKHISPNSIRALYLHYVSLLNKAKNFQLPNNVNTILRDELVRFDRTVSQFKYLNENKIETMEQLIERGSIVVQQIVEVKGDFSIPPEDRREKLKGLNWELRIVRGIEVESVKVKERLERVLGVEIEANSRPSARCKIM